MENIDYKEMYLKKQKENIEVKRQLQEKKGMLDNSKVKLTRYYNEMKKKEDLINNLNVEIKDLTNKTKEKDSLIKDKESEFQELISIKDSFNKIVNNNNNLKKYIEDLSNENISLKHTISLAKTSDQKQIEIDELSNKVNILLKEISGLKSTNKNLKENLEKQILEDDQFFNSRHYGKSISIIIERLGSELSIKTVQYYHQILNLSDRIKRILEYKDSISATRLDDEIFNKFTDNKVLYGYTVEKNEELKFIEIDGSSYDINYIPDIYGVDIPAKAILINDGTVQIESFYDDFEIPEINNNEIPNVNKKIGESELDEMIHAKKLNILVASGRNGKYYKEYLFKYGFNVDTYNPFEESINEFGNKISSQDIIIIMKNAVSHSVTEYIDKNDKRIEIIGKDSKQYLLARIRYHIVMMESDKVQKNV